MKNIIEFIQTTTIILLIIFGLFILYQIIKKITGGSWATEDIIVSLLILNIGITFTLALNQVKTNSNYNHLRNQFNYLAKDFKQHKH
jgi:hypothetical protein